jgi:hypothetical protein
MYMQAVTSPPLQPSHLSVQTNVGIRFTPLGAVVEIGLVVREAGEVLEDGISLCNAAYAVLLIFLEILLPLKTIRFAALQHETRPKKSEPFAIEFTASNPRNSRFV